MEAFLAAVFLDCGFEAARRWMVGVFEAHVDFAEMVSSQNNPKDALNRFFGARFGHLPTFEESAGRGGSGGSTCSVVVRNREGAVVSSGRGANRREAEYDAARNALNYYV